MELFYSDNIDGNICTLSEDDSCHCIKVLRHRTGEEISVIDGEGALLHCRIIDDSPKKVRAEIFGTTPDWGKHPYRLTMAVCPTKNMDRYEWFVEKGTEFGLDCIVPIIGERSERRIIRTERLSRIVLSATKQSLKGKLPEISEAVAVSGFILANKDTEALKLICCCFEDDTHPRLSIKQALAGSKADEIIVLIGPEGDFSPDELRLAIDNGFVPVHLGESRLRTETAALAAVSAVYFHFSE